MLKILPIKATPSHAVSTQSTKIKNQRLLWGARGAGFLEKSPHGRRKLC
jgi:hypothetical protein